MTPKQTDSKTNYTRHPMGEGKAFYTDPNYWDCECSDKYIHLKSRLKECRRCGMVHHEQPDSIVHEIKELYDVNDGWC